MIATPGSPRRLLDHRGRPGGTPGHPGRSLDIVRFVVAPLMGALGQWETLVPWALMGATVVATIALAAIAPETFPGGSGAAKPA